VCHLLDYTQAAQLNAQLVICCSRCRPCETGDRCRQQGYQSVLGAPGVPGHHLERHTGTCRRPPGNASVARLHSGPDRSRSAQGMGVLPLPGPPRPTQHPGHSARPFWLALGGGSAREGGSKRLSKRGQRISWFSLPSRFPACIL
jgi:hypothetical protein